MTFNAGKKALKFVDRIGMTIITLSITYGANELSHMSENVAKLNTSFAVMMARDESQNKEIIELKDRLTYLERIIFDKKRKNYE